MFYIRLYVVFQLPFLGHALTAAVNKVCKANRPGQCYTLYKNTAGPLTWTQAQQLCITYNETLATVPDLDTQQTLEKLIDTGSNTGAWLAGQVRRDDRWQLLNGEIYNKAPKESPDDNDNCGYLLVLDTVTEYFSDSCTDYKSTLCQYKDTGSGCEAGDIQVGNTCLRRHLDGVTWYTAVTACHALGYSLAKYDPELLTLNKDTLINRNIWLQVNRHPWTWNRVKGFPTSPVEYFKWDKESGTNIPGYCMYISNNNGKWRSELCDSTTGVSYFVCEKDSTKVSFNKPDYVIIVPVVVGLLVISVAIALLVVVIRRKNTRKRHQPAPNNPRVSLAPSGSVSGRHLGRNTPDQNKNKAVGTPGNDQREMNSTIQNKDIERGTETISASTEGEHGVGSQRKAPVHKQSGNNKRRSSDNRSKDKKRQGDNRVKPSGSENISGQGQKPGNTGV